MKRVDVDSFLRDVEETISIHRGLDQTVQLQCVLKEIFNETLFSGMKSDILEEVKLIDPRFIGFENGEMDKVVRKLSSDFGRDFCCTVGDYTFFSSPHPDFLIDEVIICSSQVKIESDTSPYLGPSGLGVGVKNIPPLSPEYSGELQISFKEGDNVKTQSDGTDMVDILMGDVPGTSEVGLMELLENAPLNDIFPSLLSPEPIIMTHWSTPTPDELSFSFKEEEEINNEEEDVDKELNEALTDFKKIYKVKRGRKLTRYHPQNILSAREKKILSNLLPQGLPIDLANKIRKISERNIELMQVLNLLSLRIQAFATDPIKLFSECL